MMTPLGYVDLRETTTMADPGQHPTANNDHLWCGACYLGLMIIAIPTIVILLIKKDESPSIKFHAIQALSFAVCNITLGIAFGIVAQVPVLGFLAVMANMLVSLGLFLYWVYLAVMAFTDKDPRIPVLAEFIDSNFMK